MAYGNTTCATEALSSTDKAINTANQVLVIGVTSAVAVLSLASKFSLGPSFFMLANSLQIARSMTILQTLLPPNVYEYFNGDLKIFNFEIPYVSGLASSLLAACNVQLTRYESDSKFSTYGIDSNTILNNVLRAVFSFLPLAGIYSGVFGVCKVLSVLTGKTARLAKIMAGCSTALFMNYPLQYFFERYYDFAINAILDIRTQYFSEERRELMLRSEFTFVSFLLSFLILILAIGIFVAFGCYLCL